MIIGSNILFFKNLTSTNSHTASLIKTKKLPEGTIIRTNYQSAGRGTAGNEWESEDNKNLLISIVLLPTMVSTEDQFIISMSVSLGICDFLGHFTTGISVKWPNDIYVNNDKIAGILIENSVMGNIIEHTIAGIGININQEKFLSDAPNPVSLTNLTGKQYQLDECLSQLASDLDKRYKSLISEDFGHIKRDYRSRLFLLDQWSWYHDSNGAFTGRIVDVSERGRLIVERKDGKVNDYAFKEISFVNM